jgi:hypothetical protein
VEAAFDLAGLGWLQFQWLCDWALHLLSGGEDLSWRGSADQLRIGASAEALDGQWFGAAKIEAPALVGVCWLAGEDPEKHERRALSAAKRLMREQDSGGGQGSLVMMMMNVPAPDSRLSQFGIDAERILDVGARSERVSDQRVSRSFERRRVGGRGGPSRVRAGRLRRGWRSSSRNAAFCLRCGRSSQAGLCRAGRCLA